MKQYVCSHVAGFISLLLICGGCSMREMKGSPFYSGEYDVNVPDAMSRRLNIWPLLYYRDPVISLVWPIFEHTEEHLTIRPLFSAYGDTETYSEYNVLWPLCRADTQENEYRIVPYFWGTRKDQGGMDQDYHVLFPLAWHFENQYCALFPFWLFYHDGWKNGQNNVNDYWFFGPLMRFYNAPDREAWHAALFYDYRNLDTEERYCGFPAPFAMSWSNRHAKGFFTPLYVTEESVNGDSDEGWSIVPPLLSWHAWDIRTDDRWLLGPLVHHVTGADCEGWHVTLFGRYHNQKRGTTYTGFPWPLLFAWETSHDSGLFTPLFGYEEQTQANEGYSLCPPLLARHSWKQDSDSYWIAGPLGHYEKSPDVDNWHAALFGRYRNITGESMHTGMPWPFIFSWRTRQTHGLFTPLYACQEDNTGTGTAGGSIIPPLLYWHSWAKGDDDTWLFGPLGRLRTGAEVEAWHVGPFGRYRYLKEGCEYAGFPWPLAFSWHTTSDTGLFTPVYTKNETTSGNAPGGWAASPLLLAWQTWTKDERDTWILGPLGHRLSGADIEGWHAGLFGQYHYLKDDSTYAGFPWPLAFSWRTMSGQGLFTPVYAKNETTSGNDPGGWAAAPFLLAWKSWTKDNSDTWFLCPLVRYRTGTEVEGWRAALFDRYRFLIKDCDYAGFPWPLAFSWRNKNEQGLFTPVYAFNKMSSDRVSDGWSASPLMLSWQSWQADAKSTYALAGLYGHHQDSFTHNSHLLPIYAYNEQDGRFLTPFFGWNKADAKNPDGYWYGFTPLVGAHTGSQNGHWLLPFYSFRGSTLDDSYSAYFLLLGRSKHVHRSTETTQISDTSSCYFPLFSHSYCTFTNRSDNGHSLNEGFTHRDYRGLISYKWEHQNITDASTGETPSSSTNRTEGICRTRRWQGLFPLWFSSSVSETRLDGKVLSAYSDSSTIGWIYTSKSEFVAATGQAKESDYARKRILWRFWQYERRDGDIWIDVFPAITHDTRTDGFRKTSFMWRLYRYERYPESGVDLDLFFLPLRRANRAQ